MLEAQYTRRPGGTTGVSADALLSDGGWAKLPHALRDGGHIRAMGPIAFAIYAVMLGLADEGNECYPGIGYLCRVTGISRSAIINGIAHLIQTGHISKTKSGGPQSGSNHYRIESLKEPSVFKTLVSQKHQPSVFKTPEVVFLKHPTKNHIPRTIDKEECHEPVGSQPPADGEVVMRFILRGQTSETWELTQQHIDDLQKQYPEVNVRLECERARGWINDNPTKRKTKAGMKAYLRRWVSRSTKPAAPAGAPNGRITGRDLEKRDNTPVACIVPILC